MIFPNDAIYCIHDISRYKTLILDFDCNSEGFCEEVPAIASLQLAIMLEGLGRVFPEMLLELPQSGTDSFKETG